MRFLVDKGSLSGFPFFNYFYYCKSRANRYGDFIPLIFLLFLLLAYPLGLGKLWQGSVPYFGDVPLFDHTALPFMAIALILFRIRSLVELWRRDLLARILLLATLAGILLACIQLYRLPSISGYSGVTFFYLILPLVGYFWANSWRRLIPVFLALIAIITLIISIQEYRMGLEPVGLSGNWNWNQTLLAISLPFLLLPIFHHGSRFLIPIFAWGATELFWLLFPNCSSRGTGLALLGAFILLYFPRQGVFRRIRAGLPILLAVGEIIFFIVIVFIPPVSIERQLDSDSRIQLWRGSVHLIGRSLPLGVGSGRFEDTIPTCLPEGYFLSDFASDRHPHPHNEIMLYLAEHGLVGLVWSALLIIALFRGILRVRTTDKVGLALAFATLILLLHGQLDVLLSFPLTGGIFLLLAGMFWKFGTPRVGSKSKLESSSDTTPQPRSHINITAWTIALLGILIGGYVAWINLASGIHLRNAKLARDRSDFASALTSLARSMEIKPTPQATFLQGSIELFNRKNPTVATEAFQRLETYFGLSNYSHANGLMARALAVLGRHQEALNYFERERKNFPLSGLNSGFELMTLRRCNASPDDIHQAEVRFQRAMASKELTPKDFLLLIRHPIWDDSPILRKNGLKNLKQK